MDTIDLRSDTVTWPTPDMREAMANAPVGDDVYGEDPLINELEAESAALLGKEAGLFVSSGTQGNLIAALTHCQRSEEMIVGRQAHMFRYEAGSAAAFGGIQPHIIDVQPDGTLPLDEIRHAIRGDDPHFPRTRLIGLENTQGTIGGIPITADYTAQVGAIAREHGLKLHIDGARIFNAAAALHTTAKELVAPADSVSFCLSKGLCAPVGAMLVGSRDFIHEARRTRKALGGGMRQAGILAAAGLVAIRSMTERLADDHANARILAAGLAAIPGLQVNLSAVQTNMIFFDLLETAPVTPEAFRERLKQDYNIIVSPYPGYVRHFRAVTHYWITRERVNQVIAAVQAILA
ncbi:MAG: low-specificity L-threonine aldolase [Anaerolineaceae bacterium]|nr:low-specificity L-threonine aldolase [Anaerolineaceae bacterium]